MKNLLKIYLILISLLSLLLFIHESSAATIVACVSSRGLAYILPENKSTLAYCTTLVGSGGKLVTWNQIGPKGDKGDIGIQGIPGLQGPPGPSEPDCLEPTLGDNLVGCNLTLPGVIFTTSNKDLRGINATGAFLSGLNFSGYNFTGANFTTANLTNTNFNGSNLKFTNFIGATLNNVNFQNANLCGANFSLDQVALNATTDFIAGQPKIIWNANTICPNNQRATIDQHLTPDAADDTVSCVGEQLPVDEWVLRGVKGCLPGTTRPNPIINVPVR